MLELLERAGEPAVIAHHLDDAASEPSRRVAEHLGLNAAEAVAVAHQPTFADELALLLAGARVRLDGTLHH